MAEFDHLLVDDRFLSVHPYTTGGRGPSVLARSNINRQQHGDQIRVRFEEALEDFRVGRDEQDFVYLEFTSAVNFQLDLEKFKSSRQSYRIAYIKEIPVVNDTGERYIVYKSGVYLDQRAISDFLDKIEKYLNEYTPKSINREEQIPKFNAFISNIEGIRAATLQSFWQETEDEFPLAGDVVWWEVWLDNEGLDDVVAYLTPKLEPYDIQIGAQWLHFPEHSVGLIKGTTQQLSLSLLYTNRLAELRKPRETAEFFTGLSRTDQNEWINDLRQRVDNLTAESNISVCLLDTGVNQGHPLLSDLLPAESLDTVIPQSGNSDTHGSLTGHGTPMAGLILYGDLTEWLASENRIQVYHHLESVKLISRDHAHDPQNYGYVTQEAIDRAVTIHADHKRIVCLAVTSGTVKHRGRPTSWSSAVDQYVFGSTETSNDHMLVMTSAGNMEQERMLEYPLSNWDSSIQEPAQAFNAITVGSYTQKDLIDAHRYPGAIALARRGAMAPSNTTSVEWGRTWCRKPDIVMEGGNYAQQHNALSAPDSLFLLSTSKSGVLNRWLTSFGDTSGATALASRLAAQLYHRYPNLWPETIRALIIHSAEWTQEMLGAGKSNIGQLDQARRIGLLQQVGYGVPNLQLARASAENSLTLIAESELKPFQWEDSRIKTDEFHLYRLPWPHVVLADLGAVDVRLKVTLSYFIEPNPGNKEYAKSNNYASHGLRFKMMGSTEGIEAFKARVSKAMRDDDYEAEGSETGWQLGKDCRNKGSIHKDIWEGSAADLATRNVIAIHPIGGWWKTRKKLGRYENKVRYSLVVSIEVPDVQVDIYNPVAQLIQLSVPVDINIQL